MMRRLLLLGCVAGMLAGTMAFSWAAEGNAPSVVRPIPKAGAFEALTLSLTWSPSFCASSSGHADREQCGGTAKYGFVAHGLWPVFPRGSGSAAHGCGGDSASLTDKSVEKVQGIMPSRKLINHEWEKHGTCYGGDAATYFGKVRTAWDKIKIPQRFKSPDKEGKVNADQVHKAFVEANPTLPANSFAVICQRPRGKALPAERPLVFKEVRVCFDKNLNFKACGSQAKDRCAGDAVVLPLR